MEHLREFYIDGRWVEPHGSSTHDVIDPSREIAVATIALGDEDDVNAAVAAARGAQASFAATSREERLDLLEAVIAAYRARAHDLEAAVTLEMGAPVGLARADQVPAGLNQLIQAANALRTFEFEERHGTTALLHEPVGVTALITPWNWPLLLIGAKIAPALAAGCTMVLKPSEFAPLNALLVAEILHDAGVPAGVFNLVNGTGPVVGAALSRHRDVDMVSITGSTRAGVEVARHAATTVKRVHQELGGKSANIILDDADLATVLARDVVAVMENSGQSCDAGSRILVPEGRLEEAERVAARAVASLVVGDPSDPRTSLGPVVSRPQFEKVQRLIHSALREGATLVAGGLGRPEGLDCGYFVRPTVLSRVSNDMTIAREEIFGPVVTLLTYRDEEDAIRIANDTVFGLSGYVSSADPERARRVARQIRSGMMHINGVGFDGVSPFGGYKQSGNGREYGVYGLRDFLEVKSVFGYYG